MFHLDLESPAIRVLQNALDRIAGSTSVDFAIRSIRESYSVSHVTYHLARNITDSVDAPFVRTTYPDSWISTYLLKDYVLVDPVVREGLKRRLPFDWREIEPTPSVRDFLADAAIHGLGGNGYSIPVTDKANRRALLSINSRLEDRAWETFVRENAGDWTDIAQLVHQIAVQELYGDIDPIPRLSPREVECLHWTALGKDQKDIAQLLSLSEHTVRDYLKSARLKLGCATLSAAAARAAYLRIIDPWGKQSP